MLTIVKYLLYDLAEDNFYNIWQLIVCLVVRRAVGRFEIRGIFSLPPDDIGLTDLPKSEGALAMTALVNCPFYT